MCIRDSMGTYSNLLRSVLKNKRLMKNSVSHTYMCCVEDAEKRGQKYLMKSLDKMFPDMDEEEMRDIAKQFGIKKIVLLGVYHTQNDESILLRRKSTAMGSEKLKKQISKIQVRRSVIVNIDEIEEIARTFQTQETNSKLNKNDNEGPQRFDRSEFVNVINDIRDIVLVQQKNLFNKLSLFQYLWFKYQTKTQERKSK
eukprot:TRINITY_DN7032_c0_g1_i1.p1 TRINITY_DN7032_c0_g1~~TRINITY_DN7032_c0_g1_i1.p1  ORF type:complete len:198 (-),score=15.28 TRINITY_DN7032_c0_g1_i1:24-617(-)